MESKNETDCVAGGPEMIWEIFQSLFVLGSLMTIMVNTASIKQLTWRIEELEDQWQRRHEL